MINTDRFQDDIEAILKDHQITTEFPAEQKESLVDMITSTIHQYDDSLSKEWLELIVEYFLESKFNKYYVRIPNDVNKSATLSRVATTTDISIVKDTNATDKINLRSDSDLISHVHDYASDKFTDKIHVMRKKRVAEIKKIPQHEQKTPPWYAQRNECLTATAIAIALDEDPYKYPAELLLEKCGKGEPFIENEYVHHGKKHEHNGTLFYSFRNNITVSEYGLIQHSKYSFIGASPDGICDQSCYNGTGISKLVGRLLEIKFPKTRKIQTEGDLDGDICPHQYYVQVQTQLFVTELDECDFLQGDMEEYESWNDFVADTHPSIPGLSKKTNLEKGCLIQLLPKKMIGRSDDLMCLYNSKYIYQPKLHMTSEEIEKWIATEVIKFPSNALAKENMIDKIIYWRFARVTCHTIKKDANFFKTILPTLRQFWNYVLFYRKHPTELNKLVKYIKEVGVSNTVDIFARVHIDFSKFKPDTKTQPMYQDENPWREKFNKKKEQYKKFAEFQKKKFTNRTNTVS